MSLNPPVYVKKWMRTKHAIMFRLSNKIVQVNFQDHTEILLNSESRLVTYVNKKGERQTLPLNLALESNNAEMTKRLKYTKDILTHMLNNNTNGTQKTNTNTASGSNGGMPGNPMTSSTNRMGTLTSAVSSKRSLVSGGMGSTMGLGESGMPMSVTGRTGTAASMQSNNLLSSDRRPLNVLNQG